MKYVAIDFETATSSRGSACALGAMFFEMNEKNLSLNGSASQ